MTLLGVTKLGKRLQIKGSQTHGDKVLCRGGNSRQRGTRSQNDS